MDIPTCMWAMWVSTACTATTADGTFTEVTEDAGVGGDLWTTSCLIADLNGDAIPDLYEVDYLAGRSTELMCPRTCSPAQFDAQDDRLFLGQGDGTFVDQTVDAGITGLDGKGLGRRGLRLQ